MRRHDLLKLMISDRSLDGLAKMRFTKLFNRRATKCYSQCDIFKQSLQVSFLYDSLLLIITSEL